jgi:hypothetical protein
MLQPWVFGLQDRRPNSLKIQNGQLHRSGKQHFSKFVLLRLIRKCRKPDKVNYVEPWKCEFYESQCTPRRYDDFYLPIARGVQI